MTAADASSTAPSSAATIIAAPAGGGPEPMTADLPESRGIADATVADTLRVVTQVLVPTLAKGVIVRRPGVVGLAERLDLDRRSIRLLQQLHERYGDRLLRLRLPGREAAVVLTSGDVHRVLDGSPEPFAVAMREKRAAMRHLQPEGLLVSHGRERAERRPFNEAVLQSDRPIHDDAHAFLGALAQEAEAIRRRADALGVLDWPVFVRGWFRMVRRVVLGDAAADDHELTDLLASLRADANWAFLRPRRAAVRARFEQRLQHHLDRAEPGSLAYLLDGLSAGDAVDRAQQVPQWLFAFDAAGMATFRALALLATHPDAAHAARVETAHHDARRPAALPFLRRCVLESVRLWPTTPMILRDTTTATTWGTDVLPAGTAIAIHTPYVHRDTRNLPVADRFSPELWAGDAPRTAHPLVPFSEGPAVCPGRNLVLLLTAAMLAALVQGRDIRLVGGATLDPGRPLAATLSPFDLRFALAPR